MDKDELYEEDYTFRIHQGIIFCIQLSPSICEIDPLTKKSTLTTIFESIKELISDCAISLSNTGVGCYLFNSALKSEDCKEGIHKVFRLSDINAEMLKQVNDLIVDSHSFINDGDDSKILDQNPDNNAGLQLANVLNQVQDDFIYLPRFTKTYTSKKVFLFTDCDKPFNSKTKVRITLRKILADFNDSKIGISPFLLSAPNKEFDISEYKDLLFLGSDGDRDEADDVEDEDMDNIYNPVVSQITVDKIKGKVSLVKEVKRDAYNCPLEISEGLKINVKGYSMFNETKIRHTYNYYNMGERYLNVEPRTHKLNENTGSEVSNESITKMYSFGGESIPLSSKQLDKLYSFNMNRDDTILKILGFRDLKYFHSGYTSQHATLMVPDDTKEYTHSRRTFSALYQSMTRKRKMAIVWGMPTKSSYPLLYCLMPTDGLLKFKTNSYQHDYYPQGLALIPLPYKDFIRCAPGDLPNADPVHPNNKFDEIIPQMINSVRYDKVKNPIINWHFKIIEDDILQVEIKQEDTDRSGLFIDEDIDEGQLDDAGIERGLDNLELRKQVELNNFDETKKLVMEARLNIKSDSDTNSLIKQFNQELNQLSNMESLKMPVSSTKKQKQEEKALTDSDMLVALKTGSMNKYKLEQFRVYINSRKGLIEQGKKKVEMIQNITEFLRERYPDGEA